MPDRDDAMHADAGRHWLTSLVLADRVLRWSLEALAAGPEPAGSEPLLAMRQRLDLRIRNATGWPQASDYAAAARELAYAGKNELAAVLRRAAAAEDLTTEARARWEHRYVRRPETARELVYQDLVAAGQVHFEEGQLTGGIDGACYLAGYVSDGPMAGYAVAVHSRGAAELVTGLTEQEQRSWISGRGATATGPLQPPPGRPPRVTLEEHVLASLLAGPPLVARLAPELPPDTFTADSRYEIYAAILAVDQRLERWSAPDVPAEVASQAVWLPQRVLSVYGGPDAPLLQAYCRRLMSTSMPGSAENAVRILTAEDQQGRARRSWPHYTATAKLLTQVSEPRDLPEVTTWRERRARREIRLPPAPPPGISGPQPRL